MGHHRRTDLFSLDSQTVKGLSVDDVAIPTPDPSPEVTDITAEQERRNSIASAMRKFNESVWLGTAAEAEMRELKPTPSELRRAIEDLNHCSTDY